MHILYVFVFGFSYHVQKCAAGCFTNSWRISVKLLNELVRKVNRRYLDEFKLPTKLHVGRGEQACILLVVISYYATRRSRKPCPLVRQSVHWSKRFFLIPNSKKKEALPPKTLVYCNGYFVF